MTPMPITVVEPTIVALAAGRLTRLRRTYGQRSSLANIEPGGLLWVREPFRLQKKWDLFAPTSAMERGAVAFFPPTMTNGAIAAADLGKARFARTMPRACHRQHLVVTGVAIAPLQDMTEEEMRAEGFTSRNAWVDAWDQAAQRNGNAKTWSDNPDVLVIDFELQRRPLPDDGAPQ